jgi:hypothetical protein
LFDNADVTAAYSALAGQKSTIGNREFCGKLAAEHMKVGRRMVVPKDRYIE